MFSLKCKNVLTMNLNNYRKVSLYGNRVYKSFKNKEDLSREWKFINYCNNLYPTRYTQLAIKGDNYISFPLLKSISIVTKKILDDVKKQIFSLNNAGIMHLDVSVDNIVYDSISDKYYLIDYGNAIFTEDIYRVVGNPYKKQYQNPKGLDIYSDIYALSVIERDYCQNLVSNK